MKKIIAVIIVFSFSISSCQEIIKYEWGEINESLGQLQDARNELESVISDLEYQGYDCSELKGIDNRLKKVENILDRHFY